MSLINHSNCQPIANRLIVFLDRLPNIKKENGLWVHKETDILGIDDKIREEKARISSEGIIIATSKKAFTKEDIFSSEEKPMIGDRVRFTTYAGQHTCEGDMFYRTLEDREIQHYYLPQRELITNKTE